MGIAISITLIGAELILRAATAVILGAVSPRTIETILFSVGIVGLVSVLIVWFAWVRLHRGSLR
jgi:hypothetical protein